METGRTRRISRLEDRQIELRRAIQQARLNGGRPDDKWLREYEANREKIIDLQIEMA